MNLDENKVYQRHYENSVLISANAEKIFAYADDITHFSSHMSSSSWMMGGSRMDISFDAGRGQEVGSHVRMGGKALGVRLFLEEVITRREPPHIKSWETVGTPKLLVIGHYRMNVEIEPRESGSLLRVSIDYNLPTTNAWLGKLFGGFYARWCVEQMIKGARSHFAG